MFEILMKEALRALVEGLISQAEYDAVHKAWEMCEEFKKDPVYMSAGEKIALILNDRNKAAEAEEIKTRENKTKEIQTMPAEERRQLFVQNIIGSLDNFLHDQAHAYFPKIHHDEKNTYACVFCIAIGDTSMIIPTGCTDDFVNLFQESLPEIIKRSNEDVRG